MSDNKPLWMPPGSVRSIMAMAIILPVPFFVYTNTKIPGEYWAMASIVMGLYFYQKLSGQKPGTQQGDQSGSEDLFMKLSLAEQENRVLKEKLDNPQEVVVSPVNHKE